MRRKGSLILSLVIVSCLTSSVAFAGTTPINDPVPSPTIGYKLIGGVTNKYYYIAPGADSFKHSYSGNVPVNYETAINNAIYNWNNTSTYTPIWFTKTTAQASSKIDFSVKDYTGFGWAGKTEMFDGPTKLSTPITRDWYWCNVYIDGAYGNLLNQHSREVIVAHEIGHCFGLADNDIAGSVMCQDCSFDYMPTGPSEGDCAAINIIY